tara:strand:- start:412 stop:729 length:318 start_codon:yes stop_codon:yes gene_type:complete
MTTVNIDGVSREMTAEEQAEYDAQQLAWETTGKKSLQLKSIRELRNQKLSETDYLATSDNVMSDEMKAFRKSMRDVPQNFDEDKYDELLARDSDGKLTHTVWEKP